MVQEAKPSWSFEVWDSLNEDSEAQDLMAQLTLDPESNARRNTTSVKVERLFYRSTLKKDLTELVRTC